MNCPQGVGEARVIPRVLVCLSYGRHVTEIQAHFCYVGAKSELACWLWEKKPRFLWKKQFPNYFLCDFWHEFRVGASGSVCLKHRHVSCQFLTCGTSSSWEDLEASICMDSWLLFYGWYILRLINFGSSGTVCSEIKNYLGCLDTMLILTEQWCSKPQARPPRSGSYG